MDAETHARLAQRTLLGPNAEMPDASIEVTCYRDTADFDALRKAAEAYVPGQTPSPQPANSWMAFVYSKPTFKDGRVHVHVLEEVGADGNVRERWMKLKRREAVVAELGIEAGGDCRGAAEVNERLMEALGLSRSAIRFAADERVETGPDWLATKPTLAQDGDTTTLACPYTDTPLDAPERFHAELLGFLAGLPRD